ncbi:hypothetical protein V6N11_049225 [Hibiscus sabdariffa]|uniref:Uncharacterized protein n=1 Tax=Hibiscus sabdariffa TaxID=183260 RepID=A0ABR2NKC7_9ROSI
MHAKSINQSAETSKCFAEKSFLPKRDLEWQGAFSLCRVVKSNEPKACDVHGKPKAKRVGNDSSSVELNSPRPITSTYEVTQVPPFEPVSVANYPTSTWVSPTLILDSSKVTN